MARRRRRDLGEEASDLGATTLELLGTLGALLATTAEWLGLKAGNALAAGAQVVGEQAEAVADTAGGAARKARRRVRWLLLKLVVVVLLLRWLDRDLTKE